MTIDYESLNYDAMLNTLLQKKVKLSINGKIVRQGHLVLYSFKNYCIEMYFKNKSETKLRKTDIPIPFDIYKEKDRIVFDYRLLTLHNDEESISIFKKQVGPTDNKFFNNKLLVEIQNNE